MLKAQDWIGRKFGRLTVIGLERITGAGTVLVCECSCGSIIRCKNHNLVSGGTTSCGCLWKEKITTHGMTKTRVYSIWRAMKNRCYAPNTYYYKNYGGRGIKVCDRWLESFENFLFDMGEPPENQTIDRIDNNGNYEPSNCRWATYEQQLNNTRSNRMVTAFGKTQSLTLWSRELGIPVPTLRNRLYRAKMATEVALKAPLYAQQRRKRKR